MNQQPAHEEPLCTTEALRKPGEKADKLAKNPTRVEAKRTTSAVPAGFDGTPRTGIARLCKVTSRSLTSSSPGLLGQRRSGSRA